ncbi:MAG: 50S ribosomal protein L11 methyltransferase [Verrucomicrobiota bacterium]
MKKHRTKVPWLFLPAALFLLLAAPFLIAQSEKAGPPPAEPKKPTRAPDVVFGATPDEAIEQILRMAQLKPGDVVYDLGCGDGRILVTAAKKYGVKGVGVDIDPLRVKESIENVRTNKLDHLITIKEADMFTVDISQATVLILYLGPHMNLKLLPQINQMKPGSRVFSFDFDTPGVKPTEVLRGTRLDNGHEFTIYQYAVPLTRR